MVAGGLCEVEPITRRRGVKADDDGEQLLMIGGEAGERFEESNQPGDVGAEDAVGGGVAL